MLNSRGWIRTLVGDLRGAVADYERALEYLRVLGGDDDELLVHLRLSGLKLRMGDLAGARQSVQRARGEDMSGVHGLVRQVFADGIDIQILLSVGDLRRRDGHL